MGKLEGGRKPPKFKSFFKGTLLFFLKGLLIQNLGGFNSIEKGQRFYHEKRCPFFGNLCS